MSQLICKFHIENFILQISCCKNHIANFTFKRLLLFMHNTSIFKNELENIMVINVIWHLHAIQQGIITGMIFCDMVFQQVFFFGIKITFFSRISLRISLSTFEMNLTESLGFFRSESDKETRLL